MKKRTLSIVATGLVFLASCVNDPEKHTQSEADPAGKGEVNKSDGTASDSTKTNDSVARKSAHTQPRKE